VLQGYGYQKEGHVAGIPGARGIISVLFHPGWVNTDMGGPDAPLSPTESAADLRQVLEGLRPEDSGKFFDFQGNERPW
jgi:hypothetical protein